MLSWPERPSAYRLTHHETTVTAVARRRSTLRRLSPNTSKIDQRNIVFRVEAQPAVGGATIPTHGTCLPTR